MNMAKYRKLQQEMEGAVERADMAENTLGQLRARNRSASVAPESTTTFGLTVRYNRVMTDKRPPEYWRLSYPRPPIKNSAYAHGNSAHGHLTLNRYDMGWVE